MKFWKCLIAYCAGFRCVWRFVSRLKWLFNRKETTHKKEASERETKIPDSKKWNNHNNNQMWHMKCSVINWILTHNEANKMQLARVKCDAQNKFENGNAHNIYTQNRNITTVLNNEICVLDSQVDSRSQERKRERSNESKTTW